MEPTSPPRVALRGSRPRRLLPLGLATLLCLALATAWTAGRAAPAYGASSSTIAIDVDPATPGIQSSVSYPEGTDPISVDVVIVNGTDVGAFEFELIFNHVLLEFVDWQLGPYLGSTGREVTCLTQLFENGVRIGCGTIGPTPAGVSGDGLLGTLRFHPRFPGQTCLPLTLVETASILGDPFPTTIGPTACVTILPPTPTPTPTSTDTPVPTARATDVPATARPSVTGTPRPGGTAAATHTATATSSAAAGTRTAQPDETPGPLSTSTHGSGGATSVAEETPPPDHTPAPCPQPPEYWRAHPDRWPTDVLTLGDRGYTEDELLSLLADEDNSDASLVLGRELISAKLNSSGGTGSPDSAVRTADDALRGFGRKLPLIVATQTDQGRRMVWFSGLLWGNNRRCGEVQGASDAASVNTASTGSRAAPRGLPGTGGGLVLDNSAARWTITVLCLIAGVLLVMFLRRSFADDDPAEDGEPDD